MHDADLISSVRKLRRLVSTLDSIGFPIHELAEDGDIARLVGKKLPNKVLSVSTDVHNLLQNIEKTKRYKEAVKSLCSVDRE